jgi:hypothetical protein
MTVEPFTPRTTKAASFLWQCLGIAIGVVLILAISLCKTRAADDKCWPVGDLTFPAGSRDEVTRKAAEFLIKAEAIPAHPYWPGGTSGVTLGVGWDAGYHSRTELRETWALLGVDAFTLLDSAAGKKGREAEALIPQLRAIDVPRSLSIQVLNRTLNDDYYPLVVKLFPGLERLPADAQVVFISVVFNRGPSLGHDPDWSVAKEVDRRFEMRRMQADVRSADMFAIYAHLGTMKRLWETAGPRGLPRRRRDEQALIRPYVNQQLKWEENRETLKKAGLPPCPK